MHAAYAAWAMSWLAALMTVAVLLALLLPRLRWRRAATRALARLWLTLAGLRVRIEGPGTLPDGPCVLVANHASYLDGVVMHAALPTRFGFVIKREAASLPLVGALLRRIGSEFVDRHTARGRQRDARRVVQRAAEGRSLVFFPEGTFDATPGLKRFHIGAFVAAARGNAPVVPAVLHGTRRSLPSGRLVPRPGPIRIELLGALGGDGTPADQLRDGARNAMLAHVDEPDSTVAP